LLPRHSWLLINCLLSASCATGSRGQDTSLREELADLSPKTVIVLVGHGAPPSDMPRERVTAAMRAARGADTDSGEAHEPGVQAEHQRGVPPAVREMLDWPRTRENDPYFFGVQDIARSLSQKTGLEVFVGFNELCAPTTAEAISQAVRTGAEQVVIVSVMTTPGGGHSEKDIRSSIDVAQKTYPHVKLTYAWPFSVDRIASLLAGNVRDHLPLSR
jgi:sirohydrochlorin cobaltochelatase